MSDGQDMETDEPANEEMEDAVGGQRLAQARLDQRISMLDVAKKLHLDESKVRALEQNDFAVLGAPVFAKGHLRKYAELVGIEVDDVLADYYDLTRADAVPPVLVGRSKLARDISLGPWIAALTVIVIVVAAAGFWWFASGGPDTAGEPLEPLPLEETESVQTPKLKLTTGGPVPDDSAALIAAPAADVSIDTATVEVPVVESTPAPAEAQPEPTATIAADTSLRLTVSFSGDCWTEISDADGRRMFFNMGRNGQTVELIGKAPVSALFGNSDNVSLLVDGSDYEIRASDLSKRTARLTIFSP